MMAFKPHQIEKIVRFLQWIIDNKENTNNFYSNLMMNLNVYITIRSDLNEIASFQPKPYRGMPIIDSVDNVHLPFKILVDIQSAKRAHFDEYQKEHTK